MGLLKVIRKIKRKEKEMRLLMLGLDNAGKTTVLMKFLGENIEGVLPTVGFNIRTIPNYEGGFKLNIWDVGGQKSIRSFWRSYFDKTDGLIWVVDSADTNRLELCKKELFNILKEEKLSGASLLVLANKQDIPGSLKASDIASVLELNKLSDSRHWAILECSAMNGSLLEQENMKSEGIRDGIRWIVADIRRRIYVYST